MHFKNRARSVLALAALLSASAIAQTGAPPGSAEKTIPKAPDLPDTSVPPAPKPDVGRMIKDAVLPGLGGGVPAVKPSVERTTGDEDEMDDLDVQRRTAPSDQGVTSLPNPADLLPKKPTINAPTLIKKTIANGGNVARTTGDEDEMDDLDVQRRTAPSDQGGTPLPAPNTPLMKGKAGAAIKTLKPVYRADQQVLVEYSGMPGNFRDWITIVPTGTPEDKYGDWVYLEGETSGTYKFKKFYQPGTYEVRAFKDVPNGDDESIAVASFEVR